MSLYPSDEELNNMVKQIEKEALYAPKRLRYNVIERIKADKKDRIIKRFDSIRIVAGMVAAVVLAFVIPSQSAKWIEASQQVSLQTSKIYEELNRNIILNETGGIIYEGEKEE